MPGKTFGPGALATDAGFQTCLAFSRHELQRKLAYSGRIGRTLAGAILFTLGAFVAPHLFAERTNPAQLQRAAPALVLLMIWAVMFVVMRKREKQTLRRELNELDGLDSD